MKGPAENKELTTTSDEKTARSPKGYASRRATKRNMSRSRLEHRVVSAVEKGSTIRDPLKEISGSGGRRLGLATVYLALAVGLHLGIAASLSGFRGSHEKPLIAPTRSVEKVTVRVTRPEAPKPVENAQTEDPSDHPVVPVEEAEPVQTPKAPDKKPSRSPKKSLKRDHMPADPVDMAKAPAADDGKPRRRVVGISFESTVSAGGGPSFAVGNTRMGTTDATAEDASKIGKLGPATEKVYAGPKSEKRSGPNQVAAFVPEAKVSLTKPKRISKVELDYPSGLKARGLEGNVVMMIRIDASGKVVSAKILSGSGYDEFDEAARRAAKKEMFKPATRDGEPVDYNLKYTYRFRIRES